MKTYFFAFLLILVFKAHSQNLECNPDENSRTRILVDNNPNNFTCFIEMTRGWSTYYGTGALIHPRVVITAGHNIAYFPVTKRPPFVLFSGTRKVNLYFGSIDSKNHKATVKDLKLKKSKTKFFMDGYWSNSAIFRDFAIIILPDLQVYNTVKGHYKLSYLSESDIKDKEIQIIGSPGDKDLFEMWTSKTKNFRLEDGGLKYDLYTEVRNSGSPIFISNNSDFQLIGVHSRSFGKCNASVFLDNNTYDQIVEWCKSIGVDITK